MSEKRYEIRALSLGEMIDGAFQLYRNNLRTFLLIAAAIAVPLYALIGILGLSGDADMVKESADRAEWFGLAALLFTTAPAMVLAYVLQQATLTVAIADAYLGQPITLKSCLHKVVPQLIPILMTSFIVGLFVGLGMLLLIIPGLILFYRWIFVLQTISIEGKTTFEAMKRSAVLTRGRKMRIAEMLLILGLIQAALGWGFRALLPEAVETLPVIGTVIANLPELLMAPLYPGVITLAYFDARVRDEAFDLEVLAQGLGSAPAATLPHAAHSS